MGRRYGRRSTGCTWDAPGKKDLTVDHFVAREAASREGAQGPDAAAGVSGRIQTVAVGNALLPSRDGDRFVTMPPPPSVRAASRTFIARRQSGVTVTEI